MQHGDDHDYIIRVIQFLESQFAIRFFISSKDFDVLYRWWEKRIPFSVVRRSLSRVVERRLAKNKPITSFAAFSHDVRQEYNSFLSLSVGRARPEGEPGEHDEIKAFLRRFPEGLEFLKRDFEQLAAERLAGHAVDAAPLHEKLLGHFQNDAELNARCSGFMKNLAPALRRPEIERKYRLNYLLHRFSIPVFD
jgi:hypothetical protein